MILSLQKKTHFFGYKKCICNLISLHIINFPYLKAFVLERVFSSEFCQFLSHFPFFQDDLKLKESKTGRSKAFCDKEELSLQY